MVSLAIVCVINGRMNCLLNTVFFIPVFIYAFYISDFNEHLPFIETIFYTVWWLLFGLLFLLYFAKNKTKIVFYFIISIFTIVFQLLKADGLFYSFSMYKPFVTHPLIVFLVFSGGSFILWNKFIRQVALLSDQLKTTNQGINKVFQDSIFSLAEIKAESDEQGNVVKLWIEKVNNAFESSFNINLHEVQNQEADYVFNLLFRNQFDVNKILLFERPKTLEFYAENLECWLKVSVLKPEHNKFYLIFEDITKTKKTIEELEAGKQRYKVLLEAIPDIFFVIDKDGMYEDFVIKESDLFKIEDASIVGNTIFDVGFPENMADKIYKYIQNCINHNSIETIEYSLNTPNGTFLFEMRLAKLNSHSVISVARDITRQKTAELNLEKAKIKAEESDRLKSVFLTNLSHEVRTPLNIITNFSWMLAEPDLGNDEKIEFAEAISQNGKQLLNMIENTIHLSKIETESVTAKVGFCKINPLVRDIYNQFLSQVPDFGKFKINLKLDVPNPVFGFDTDGRLLSAALGNLIDNAVKYTSIGEITFGYEMIKNEGVKFFITDTGIGIPKDEIENIFSRFYRVKNQINEASSGSGIGLPIAQHYIGLLGGELQLESIPDKGTKIWFTLPFKEGQGYLRVVS
jgi:PAS domain S-box-containing protein